VSTTRRNGRRFVLALYTVIVGIAGVLGLILGEYVFAGSSPELFFVIDLPATAVGFATFGIVTVGVGLGLPLVLVGFVSRRVDDKDT